MPNTMNASNKCSVTWRKGEVKTDNGEWIGCLHLTLYNEYNNVVAKASLSANQIAAFCLNNNKLISN